MQMNYTNREMILEYLKSNLAESRYRHSLGVEEEAVRLADKYGEDRQIAALAGLLHDCAKNDIIVRNASKYGVQLDEYMQEQPALAHAVVGAAIAEKVFGLADEKVLSAIRCHTLGREGMSLLDKIIYIADYIEPNRDFEGVEQLRALSYQDLDKAVLKGMAMSLSYVMEKEQLLHPASIGAYNSLLMDIRRKKNARING